MNLIVIAGMPATGKSTVAEAVCKKLQYPVFEKDGIKEKLFDTVGFDCYAEKRALDHAANAVLLHVLEEEMKAGRSVIAVNNFDTASCEKLSALLEKYSAKCLIIFMSGDENVLCERYAERDRRHARHLGHIVQEHYPLREGDSPDHIMTPEEFHEKFVLRGMTELKLEGCRLDVDTTDLAAVNIDNILKFIEENL